jgi:uncharacterized protein
MEEIMPLQVNLRHLDEHNLELEGELNAAELDIQTRDDMLRLSGPVRYELDVQKLEEGLLLQGRLTLGLDCQCVRCLKPFRKELNLDPWTAHLPFQGEEAVPVNNDMVDLTPVIREDILLEFPQHPLCDPECRGLPKGYFGKTRKPGGNGTEAGSSAWDQLNKLKL